MQPYEITSRAFDSRKVIYQQAGVSSSSAYPRGLSHPHGDQTVPVPKRFPQGNHNLLTVCMSITTELGFETDLRSVNQNHPIISAYLDEKREKEERNRRAKMLRSIRKFNRSPYAGNWAGGCRKSK